MYLRRIGSGVSAILALSACNAIVGVEDVQGTGPGGSSSSGDVGGMGGNAGAGGMAGSGGSKCISETDCTPPDPALCRMAVCNQGVCDTKPAPVDTECGLDARCDVNGECKKDLGVDCTDDDSCSSGICVDGICCASKCDQTCEVCLAPMGTCVSLKDGALDDTGTYPTCSAPYACDSSGACTGDRGVVCGNNGQCESGLCVDGVCCETPCSDTCEACNVPGSLGICSPMPVGLDDNYPTGSCIGPNVACYAGQKCLKEVGASSTNPIECASGNINLGICTQRNYPMLTVGCGGANGTESCCASKVVEPGSFDRNNDPAYRAEIGEFALDRYEVTVGRFREFLSNYDAAGTKPAAGAGKHPRIDNSGWDSDWDTNLLGSSLLFKTALLECGMTGTVPTWSNDAGTNDQLPINCVTWYEALAFCIWDGGRLPTEAEWNYAAAGGDLQRTYPSGTTMITNAEASFDCMGDGTCALTDILRPGGKSPGGDARWMHADMAGNMAELTLDLYSATPVVPCVDCANFMGTNRTSRGGGWRSASNAVTTQSRVSHTPTTRSDSVGFRCARDNNPTCGNGVVDAGEECDDKALDPKISAGCKRCDKVEKVVAGDSHACVITKKGRLKCWGDNSAGQLGQGTTAMISEPSKWPFITLPSVKDVALSHKRTCALTEKGDVKCFGTDNITVGTLLTGLLGTGVSGQQSLGDNPGEMKGLASVPLMGFEATAIVSGRAHSCAIVKNTDNNIDEVRCWGSNAAARLGIGTMSMPTGAVGTPVFDVSAYGLAASYDSTCALLGSTSIACWGNNNFDGSTWGALGLDSVEEARGDMPNDMKPPTTIKLPSAITNIKAITSSGHHYCILAEDGGSSLSTYCWGYNPKGQLGHGDKLQWGDAQGGRMMNMLPPTPLGANLVQVSAGRSHSCALYSNGEIKCWGSNVSGELCLGTKNDANNNYDVGDQPNEITSILPLKLTNAKAIQISAGDRFTCALFDNGGVKCWGDNTTGQAGVVPLEGLTDYLGDDVNETLDDIPYVDPL